MLDTLLERMTRRKGLRGNLLLQPVAQDTKLALSLL